MKRLNFALTAPARFGIACLLSTAAACLGQVSTPVMGVARLGDGSLRILYGVQDNVIVDSQSLGLVEAASFSDRAALVSKHGSIELIDRQFHAIGEYDSADPNVLLNVDGGVDTAIAWLPSSKLLLYWDGTAFQATRVNGLQEPLTVTSVRRKASNADLLLSNANGSIFQASVSLKTGDVTSLAPLQGIDAPAFWAGERILFASPKGLAVQERNGAVEPLAATGGNLSFSHISSEWVLVTSATTQRSWAVNVSTSHVRVSEVPAIPAATQEAVR